MAAVHATAVSGFAAAGHYESVRPDYPGAAIDKIIQHCGLTSSELHLVHRLVLLRFRAKQLAPSLPYIT